MWPCRRTCRMSGSTPQRYTSPYRCTQSLCPTAGRFSQITPCLRHPGTGRETQPQCAACSADFQNPQQIDTHTTHAWPPPQHLSQPLERKPQSTPSQEKSWRPQSCACGAWRRCADAWLSIWPRALWLAFRGGAAVGQSPQIHLGVPPPPTHTHAHAHPQRASFFDLRAPCSFANMWVHTLTS